MPYVLSTPALPRDLRQNIRLYGYAGGVALASASCAPSLPWVNTFISNLKTAIRATYHHFDFAQYRRCCLAQAHYRINRRFHLASLVGRMVWASARTAPARRALAAPGAAERQLRNDADHQRGSGAAGASPRASHWGVPQADDGR